MLQAEDRIALALLYVFDGTISTAAFNAKSSAATRAFTEKLKRYYTSVKTASGENNMPELFLNHFTQSKCTDSLLSSNATQGPVSSIVFISSLS
jgi:hypothetical protein